MRPIALALALVGCSLDRVTTTAAGSDTSSATTADASTTSATGGPVCAPGRAEDDRPDDAPGLFQIRVNYVLPADGVDEQLDLDGRIDDSIAAIEAWFARESGGRALRFDTCDGQLDIRFVRLATSEAALKAEGVYIRDAIEAAMKDAGLLAPDKLEAVYYGGDADSTCGGGPWPPALVGRVAAFYLKGTFADPLVPACDTNPIGASVEAPGYADFALLHEIMHALGGVPACAPNHALSGHTADDPSDLMYAGDQPWQPAALDIGADDYFDHGEPGCLDLADSAFLDPLPAQPVPPPGW